MIKLRKWQEQCLSQALRAFESQKKHFFVMATPGAGKTTLSAILAKTLIDQALIDFVVCITPSINVSSSFRDELELRCSEPFDGQLGARGLILTYQSLSSLSNSFLQRFSNKKILLICDEVHHCGGNLTTVRNSWGDQLLNKIENNSDFVLSLSGTPWRSDNLPMSIGNYCETNGIQCDYIYGLSEAIKDQVCRAPNIIAIDNEALKYSKSDAPISYSSLTKLLTDVPSAYRRLLTCKKTVGFLLEQARNKLDALRRTNPQAGGLIVAKSITHALWIQELLLKRFNESAKVITSNDEDAHEAIDIFKKCSEKWVISVGMISEGTNIPRLQVCCYLSNIKTELYFRQVLGRILRYQNNGDTQAFLYMLAEPRLIEYAEQVMINLPEICKLIKLTGPSGTIERFESGPNKNSPNTLGINTSEIYEHFDFNPNQPRPVNTSSNNGEGIKYELSISEKYFSRLLVLDREFCA